MNAEKWLNQMRKLDELINAKIAERERLNDLATDISPKMPDGMPHSNTGVVSQKMQNAVIEIVMLSNELNKLIDQYVDQKEQIVKMLEELPDKEYGVLHRYYIRYMTIDEIADDMGYCSRQILRIKKNGLKNLEVVLACHIKK